MVRACNEPRDARNRAKYSNPRIAEQTRSIYVYTGRMSGGRVVLSTGRAQHSGGRDNHRRPVWAEHCSHLNRGQEHMVFM